jgi:hypothetical protein
MTIDLVKGAYLLTPPVVLNCPACRRRNSYDNYDLPRFVGSRAHSIDRLIWHGPAHCGPEARTSVTSGLKLPRQGQGRRY